MERIPEPELMDDVLQARAYAEADFDEPHTMFVSAFGQQFDDFESGTVLDLGCGPADIVCRFAKVFSACRIDAVDGSAAMLALAQERVAREGLQQRVILQQVYLPGDAMPSATYDVIISNSLLHHLKNPRTLWQAIRQYGRSGTRVFVMDLSRPLSKRSAQQLVDAYAATEPPVLRHDFYHSLLAAYTVDEILLQLAEAGLAGLDVEQISDRHNLISGRLE